LEYVKKPANARHFSSWTENKLTFDGTPLSDLVSVLEENYGLRVVVSDSALLGQRLWGSVPSNDATLLLQAITTSFDFKIKEVGDRVIISRAREQRGK
ncbi:MAG TPA: DUF4974 domain-containing protein, partial [Terriglobia bacterium]|nr:DUF4974 domain-containing protein [Terriglobia bacterium]